MAAERFRKRQIAEQPRKQSRKRQMAEDNPRETRKLIAQMEESLRVLSGIAQRTRAKKLLISGAAVTGAPSQARRYWPSALHRVPAASISGGCSSGCRRTLRLS
jgi:hypothetical protein